MRPFKLRVLIGCESSGVVREAFRRLGHEAWSCDLQAADDGSPYHLQADLTWVLDYPMRVLGGKPRWMQEAKWDLLIAHPSCTYLCNSGVWALSREPARPTPGVLYGAQRMRAMHDAADFFLRLYNSRVPHVAIENPVMHKYARAAIEIAHDQTIQPYQFGDDASKCTCLWLKRLPALEPTRYVRPRCVCAKCGATYWPYEVSVQGGCLQCGGGEKSMRLRWANQTDSGQNRLGPSADRWKKRSRTYPGIAQAMAEQWGRFLQESR